MRSFQFMLHDGRLDFFGPQKTLMFSTGEITTNKLGDHTVSCFFCFKKFRCGAHHSLVIMGTIFTSI